MSLTLVADGAAEAKELRLAAHVDHVIHRHARQHPHEPIGLVVLRVEFGKRESLELMSVLIQRILLVRCEQALLQAGQSLVDVGGEPAARELAVIGDIDTDFDLLADHLANAIADGQVEGGGVIGRAERARFHALDDLAGADQAAGMGGQDAVGAALHAAALAIVAFCRQDCQAIVLCNEAVHRCVQSARAGDD